MDTYTISNDIKGSRRQFFRDDFEEWIEQACEKRTSGELFQSRYEQWQAEEFERMDEEGIDRSRMEW